MEAAAWQIWLMRFFVYKAHYQLHVCLPDRLCPWLPTRPNCCNVRKAHDSYAAFAGSLYTRRRALAGGCLTSSSSSSSSSSACSHASSVPPSSTHASSAFPSPALCAHQARQASHSASRSSTCPSSALEVASAVWMPCWVPKARSQKQDVSVNQRLRRHTSGTIGARHSKPYIVEALKVMHPAPESAGCAALKRDQQHRILTTRRPQKLWHPNRLPLPEAHSTQTCPSRRPL